MSVTTCTKYINLRNIGFATANLNLLILNPTISTSSCFSTAARCIRFNSSLCNSNSKSRLLQSYQWFNRKSAQVVNYYVKKKDKAAGPSNKIYALLGGITSGLIISAIGFFGQPNPDFDLYKDEPTVLGYIYRFRDILHEYRESCIEPSSDLLLPDPLPEPYIQPKYTLVLELTDVLVHPEYDRTCGWRFRKRPGIGPFLKALTMPLFEIVIFTREHGYIAAPVVDGLDPEGCIMYRLYRDATKYMQGMHVKDLSKLNRDLTKIILVDCDGKTSKLQPRNSLVLPKWEGDTKDISLLELIPFFHAIAMSNVDDVRPVLDFYRNEEDPVAAFRRNQDLLRQQQEEMMLQQQQKRSGGSFLGGFFGRK